MYQKIRTTNDLKQDIEDLFARTRRKEITQTQIATFLKRSMLDRILMALDELVREGRLTRLNGDPVSPCRYRLSASQESTWQW